MGVSAYINIILNGICVGGMYGLMSSAFTFQVGSLRMVNFTYGACIMLSMYLTFFFIRMVNAPVILAALGVITTIRSTKFRISRILPGQSYSWTSFSTISEKLFWILYFWQK